MKNIFDQICFTLIFGTASIVLGLAQYQVPGLEGVYSDLREIPLLIAIFHLRKPWLIVLLAFLTSLPGFFLTDGDFSTTFIMHVAGLAASWIFYTFLNLKKVHVWLEVMCWVLWIMIYYVALVFPVMLISDLLQEEMDVTFWSGYVSTISSSYIEILATALVTSIYLVQLRARRELKQTNLNLESIVEERTRELLVANQNLKELIKQLEASHEEVTLLNENLEQIILERTERIKLQLSKLQKYAYSNSHEVRGPLARILGLINILENESNVQTKLNIINMVKTESIELDLVIRKMNRILEDDDFVK